MEKSEKDKIRKLNEVREPIYRQSSDRLEIRGASEPRIRDRYPFEKGLTSFVTKDFFCCKGSLGSCRGKEEHSLPLKEGKEYIPPLLPDLLDFVQGKLESKVIVTCGHRCMKHQIISEPQLGQKLSKHLIGAEVDFYVKGLEDKPLEVIKAIMEYYKEKEDLPYMTQFFRVDKGRSSHFPSWMNKEVIIHLLDKDEGRDLDNSHPYPYICVELRYDRETGKGFNAFQYSEPLEKR